ncbi:protein phosphatase 1G isoform X2 [Bufo bufo]|uniref:protein phosphatase 1G isoform X2 n=1 Tax=Bufo bufo TaxID=8384 RepID=UPI001ABDEA8A|nr:protein phosphatase 1G isoform X2 [Bufo bufo]
MGAYLSQPNTSKSSGGGGSERLTYGYSAMQGWRVSMEDAHNCIPKLDSETAMFSVYDGHGGEEVALYCSKYLPDIIKEQKAYAEDKLQKALEDAFLAIDEILTQEHVIKELSQMAGRPINDQENKNKVADEDDDKTDTDDKTTTVNGDLEPDVKCKNGKKETSVAAVSSSDEGGSGSGSSSHRKAASEAVSSSTGEAGPSCSSCPTQPPSTEKSKFFEDSEESEAEDEEDDSEECSEEEYSSEEAENEEDSEVEEDEEEEEDEEDEDAMLPGMDGKEEPGSDSGTTAVVALIRGKQLIVANAGDSRCVVSEGGKAVDMSYDHKPEDELELARIKNAGGKVTMDGRVNGGLNLSRAIGDHFYKRNRNLPPEEQMISALPDIKVLTLNEEHEFMVIACDGIWNVMSSQEVVDFIHERISQHDESGEPVNLSSIVEELLDQCLAPDTSGDGTGCDNMTCIIVRFQPYSHSSAEGSKRKLDVVEAVTENCNDGSKKAKTD